MPEVRHLTSKVKTFRMCSYDIHVFIIFSKFIKWLCNIFSLTGIHTQTQLTAWFPPASLDMITRLTIVHQWKETHAFLHRGRIPRILKSPFVFEWKWNFLMPIAMGSNGMTGNIDSDTGEDAWKPASTWRKTMPPHQSMDQGNVKEPKQLEFAFVYLKTVFSLARWLNHQSVICRSCNRFTTKRRLLTILLPPASKATVRSLNR